MFRKTYYFHIVHSTCAQNSFLKIQHCCVHNIYISLHIYNDIQYVKEICTDIFIGIKNWFYSSMLGWLSFEVTVTLTSTLEICSKNVLASTYLFSVRFRVLKNHYELCELITLATLYFTKILIGSVALRKDNLVWVSTSSSSSLCTSCTVWGFSAVWTSFHNGFIFVNI